MSAKPITIEEFKSATKGTPYYSGRWPYMSVAIDFAVNRASATPPRTVLEIGSSSVPLFTGSSRMDLPGVEGSKASESLAGLTIHDATVVPWPYANKQFDVAIALQVWEHLNGKQYQAFRELMRVSSAAVLSVPWLWTYGRKDHRDIAGDVVRSWTGREPDECRLVGRASSKTKRMVLLYRF